MNFLEFDDAKSEFWNSIEKGDWKMAQELLDQIPSLLHLKHEKQLQTPLSMACQLGHFHLFQQLLQLTPESVNLLDSSGSNCLLVACSNENDWTIANFLLDSNDLPMQYQCDNFGMTPSLVAAKMGNLQLLQKILLRFPESIWDRDYIDSRNCLSFAAENGHFDVVKFLYSKQPDLAVEVEKFNEETAASRATTRGHVEISNFLSQIFKDHYLKAN